MLRPQGSHKTDLAVGYAGVAGSNLEGVVDRVLLGLLDPALAGEIEGLSLFDGADCDYGVEYLFIPDQFIGGADDAHEGLLLVGEADEDSDVFVVTSDEAESAVNGVDPEAGFGDVDLLVNARLLGQHVVDELVVVVVDGALELLVLLADDAELGEVKVETTDQHGLYLIVGLRWFTDTSVT